MKESEPGNNPPAAPSPKADLPETDHLVPAAFDRDPRGRIWKATILLLAVGTLAVLSPVLVLSSDLRPEFQFVLPLLMVFLFGLLVECVAMACWKIRTWKLRTKFATREVERFERIREQVRARATEPSARSGRIDWLSVLFVAFLLIVLVSVGMANDRIGRHPEMVLCVLPFAVMFALWSSSRERKKSLARLAERLERGDSPEEVFFGVRTGKEATSNASVLSGLSRARALDNPIGGLRLGYSPRAGLFAGYCASAVFLIYLLLMILFGRSYSDLVASIFVPLAFAVFPLAVVFNSSPCGPLAFRYAVLPRKAIIQADGAAVECIKGMLADLEPVLHKPVRKSRKPVTQDRWNAVMGSRPFLPVGGDDPVRNVSAREVAFFLSVLDELDFVKESGLLFYARPQSFWLWSTGFRLYAE